MSGWWITIRNAADGELEQLADGKAGRKSSIASWEADLTGLDWIEKLLQEGRAMLVKRNAYPNQYRTTVRELRMTLPQVLAEEPEYWRRDVRFDSEALAALPPEMELDVIAYDLS